MENSKIEWTDHTFNPWIGCTKVSPGCAHCYAETRDQRFAGGIHWGHGAPRQRTGVDNWKQPLKWDSLARLAKEFYMAGMADEELRPQIKPYVRPRVFCASLADWLDDEVPIEWLADLLDLIRRTPNLDWLPLTKRPLNWRPRLMAVVDALYRHPEYQEVGWWIGEWLAGRPPLNVWIGTTVENQEMANLRIPQLLAIPAKVRFLSCEPLLGSISLTAQGDIEADDHGPDRIGYMVTPDDGKSVLQPTRAKALAASGIHWVIAGGESGPGARPMHPDWSRSLRDQCQDAGVPFLFKQWGEYLPSHLSPQMIPIHERAVMLKSDGVSGAGPIYRGATAMLRVGKKLAGRLLDGREWNEFPA